MDGIENKKESARRELEIIEKKHKEALEDFNRRWNKEGRMTIEQEIMKRIEKDKIEHDFKEQAEPFLCLLDDY